MIKHYEITPKRGNNRSMSPGRLVNLVRSITASRNLNLERLDQGDGSLIYRMGYTTVVFRSGGDQTLNMVAVLSALDEGILLEPERVLRGALDDEGYDLAHRVREPQYG